MITPNLIVIAQPKTGSTSFHKYLSNFPEISVHYHKESWAIDPYSINPFLNFDVSFKSSKNTKYFCDFCSYLPYDTNLDFFFNNLKNCKIIFLHRDPVERTISHYYHELSNKIEQRSLNRAINDESNTNYNDEYYFSHFAYIGQSKLMIRINNFINSQNNKSKYLEINLHNLIYFPEETELKICKFLNIEKINLKLEKLNFRKQRKNFLVFYTLSLPNILLNNVYHYLKPIVPNFIILSTRNFRHKINTFFRTFESISFKQKIDDSSTFDREKIKRIIYEKKI